MNALLHMLLGFLWIACCTVGLLLAVLLVWDGTLKDRTDKFVLYNAGVVLCVVGMHRFGQMMLFQEFVFLQALLGASVIMALIFGIKAYLGSEQNFRLHSGTAGVYTAMALFAGTRITTILVEHSFNSWLDQLSRLPTQY